MIVNEGTPQQEYIPDEQLREMLDMAERVDGSLTKWEGDPDNGGYIFEIVHIEDHKISKGERFDPDGPLTESILGGELVSTI